MLRAAVARAGYSRFFIGANPCFAILGQPLLQAWRFYQRNRQIHVRIEKTHSGEVNVQDSRRTRRWSVRIRRVRR
jgi:hypothetical protein